MSRCWYNYNGHGCVDYCSPYYNRALNGFSVRNYEIQPGDVVDSYFDYLRR